MKLISALIFTCLAITCYAAERRPIGDYLMHPLQVGENGPYAELAIKPNPDNLALVYIPSLGALLHRAAELKGNALSDPEKERIRMHADVVAMRKHIADKVVEDRGGVE